MFDRRTFLHQLAMSVLGAASAPALARAQTATSSSVAAGRARALFSSLADKAKGRLHQPAIGPARVIPELSQLSYDQHRQIRYRPARSLWRGERRYFEVQFFHPGFKLNNRTVDIVLHDASGAKVLPFDPTRFSYPAGLNPARFAGAGYTGLRVHAPFKKPDYPDEFLVFQGASYFRAVGRGEGYGMSARCLAVDTGGKQAEEFPEIVALHLVVPEPGDRTLHILAEARSARTESAFHFEAAPGDTTTLDVEAAVYLRAPVEVLGLAPLTSMFLFGEEQPGRFGDYRPEVHDSDGLVMVASNGEQIFRPLRNPERTTVSSFQLDDPAMFALVQRDRQLASYQDYESRFDLRPSVWVEPRGGWGAGAVRLLEIGTRLETDDNIVALFAPSSPKQELRYAYRVSFGPGPRARNASAQVRSFRSGIPGAGWQPATDGSRLFVIDWSSGGTDSLAELDTRVDVTGGKAVHVTTEKNAGDGSWRTAFRVYPAANDVELRAFLHRGGRAVSETLAYLWQPGKEMAAQ